MEREGINLKLINKKDNKVIISINKKLYRPTDVISTRGIFQKQENTLSGNQRQIFYN